MAGKFELDPLAIDESVAKGVVKRLARECVENISNFRFVSNGGLKNLQKKAKAIFKDGSISGFYIGERDCLAMFVIYAKEQDMFSGAYLAKVNGKYSLYYSDMRFSRHSIQRLIQRLKTKNPRLDIARAIHEQTKYVLTRDAQKIINIQEKWRTPGLNSVDTALPYVSNGELLGMWFTASTSDVNCTFVGRIVAKTFVDSEKLREPQYAKCMEAYNSQLAAHVNGEKMPNFSLLNET
ncbi:hypothetical protein ACU8KP_002152 [Vibrio fluvialis]|nr:hypothetical protein [Vibrio fluvialis]